MNKFIIFLLLFIANLSFAGDPFALPPKATTKQETIKIYYSKAKALANTITNKQSHLLSDQGHLIIDSNNNQLWIEDTEQHMAKIKAFIHSVDLPISQILIKAKILLIDDNASKQLGIFFNIATNSEGYLSIPFINIANQHLFDLKLMALEKSGHATIISAPKIITNNRQSALIESGDEIPYQEKTSQGNTSITFKKAVLSLKVTPTILPQNKIQLSLNISQDKPGNQLIHGVPTISTERLQTQITVTNHKTLILGGIHEQSTNHHHTGIPWIAHWPIIGLFFKSKHSEFTHKELIIFITPSLLKE